MKILQIVILLFISITFSNCSDSNSTNKNYTALVNPFIGTVGDGKTFSGPVLPYGMIQSGPYLMYSEDQNSGTLFGFSQTHLSGMAGGGNGTQGDILFMPTLENGPFFSVCQSGFLHSSEIASPGYYKVKLDDSNITVELTATIRAGLNKYTFPESSASGVYLKLENGFLTVKGDEISGCNNNRIYFVARFSKPFKSFELANNDQLVNETETIKGENMKGFFRFDTRKDEAILLKVGISMVSVEGARNNLKKELPGWDFKEVRKNAENAWNKELGKIQVEGGTKTEQTIFYTSLYHSMIHPNIFMDVDRKYRSTNGKIYVATDFDNYTNFSLWDTFRALHPLYTIINRKLTSQFIRTFLERYDHNGRMLIMEFDGVEGDTPPMIGYHSLSVLADAYVKGIRDFERGFPEMKQELPIAPAEYYLLPNGQHGIYAEYFNNRELEGKPVLTRIENSIDFNLGIWWRARYV